MKIDATRWRQAIATRGADCVAYLLHGPDEGAIAAAARQFADGLGDGVERIDLDGPTLRADPARLTDEAASLSLFGSARYIRVGPAGDEILASVTALIAADQSGNPVLILAPGMKATARVAKAVTESRNAGAIAFYEPGPAEAERLAAGAARDMGLIAAPGTVRAVIEAAGGDRGIVLRELEKLALYLDAHPDRPVPMPQEAVDAIAADRGEGDTGAVVAAAVAGDPAALAAALSRLSAEGASPVPWLRAIVRRLMAIAEMRIALDRGEDAGGVMKRHRVFFREEAATLAALRLWNPAMAAKAIDRMREAERAVMSGQGGIAADAAAIAIARGVAGRR